uniref:F-box protein CPR1-like n=1 Tax=Tanacetum cinerariifolium TaxID=118510 RepID=A0A6L2N0G6_TANCI|nr:F-box protein CPR1-like [Tanacetum cinerariifolium]
MMEISSKAKIKKEWKVKLVESISRFDKWKESSKNLVKLINSSMSSRTKLGLGFKETIGSDEVFDLSTPSVFDPKPKNREVKSLYERFVKAGEMRKVPPPITGTFMPTSYKSDLEETQETFRLKPKTNDSSSTIDVKILPKSDVKDPSPTNGIPSCSFNENVKPPKNLCNKSGIADSIHYKNNFVRTKTCFVCGSKTHLIKDCDVYDNVPSIVSKAAFVPAGRRNSSASISAGRSIPAASRNRPASIHAGRRIPAGRFNKPIPFPAGRYVHPHVNKDICIVDSRCLIPRFTQNWMVFTIHVPFWNEKWLVQGGTALELASPEQTATGKDVSNPFMAVMVCQKPLGYFSSPMIHVPRAGLFPHFCWFLVAVVWLFAAVLLRSCCWNKVSILELSSEDLSRILKLTLSNSKLGEDCWELQISLDKCCLNTLMWSIEPMTSQFAFSFPDPTSFSTQQATFTSFSPGQTYVTSEPVTNSQPNPQTSNNFQNQQFEQYHTATLSSNNAKFPYLKKEEYETCAMKMEYWIMNTDHNLWKIIQNGNNKKSIGRDSKGRIIILPSSLPEGHMADFHYLDDAREIWLAVKARFDGNEESKKIRKTMLKQEFSESSVYKEEGLHKGYDRFQKILSQLNQMHVKPDNDDVNMKFLSALPPSWSQVAVTLKTRGGLEYLSFDDLYNELRYLEIDVKGGSGYGSRGRKIKFNNKDPARFYRRKARCYNCLPLGHFAKECNVKKVDEKARYSAFKILEEKTKEPKAMVSVDSMLNWNEHEAEKKTEEGEQVYGLMAGFKSDFIDHAGNAAGIVSDAAAEFAMMGISSKETTGSDEVFDLSTPSVFDPEPENREVKSLYERFVKAGEMREVPPPITGTFMPTSYKSNLEETQETFGSKSNTSSMNTSESNDFVSCDNCDNKTHLIMDCDVYDNVPSVVLKAASVLAGSRNSSASISVGRSIPAASRNRPASIHAGRRIPAGSFNKPAPFPAGRSVPTGWTNHAARPFFRPTNLYFDNVFWPGIYDHMSMNDGRWGSAVKSSADQMLLFHDPAVFDVPADCSCWFPHFCWFLVVAVWLFAAVLFRSCYWNKVTILELFNEDLSRILKLTLSNLKLGEDCWELQISLDIDQVNSHCVVAHMEELIPDDIYEKIFLRLDVRNLVRCKSVCRSWKSSISGGAQFNLSYNINENGHTWIGKAVFLIANRNVRYHFIDSSNGLVCISDAKELLVDNPLTREVKALQYPLDIVFDSSCWGFGYDSITGDFKVVLGVLKGKDQTCFQVISLKSNAWKVIGEVQYICSKLQFVDVLCNGESVYLSKYHVLISCSRTQLGIFQFDICSTAMKSKNSILYSLLGLMYQKEEVEVLLDCFIDTDVDMGGDNDGGNLDPNGGDAVVSGFVDDDRPLILPLLAPSHHVLDVGYDCPIVLAILAPRGGLVVALYGPMMQVANVIYMLQILFVELVGDSDDALVCCIENTVEDRIMDSSASFHATYCKEELERFKLRSGKTLKDVRYIPGLKRRLISVGQLDEEDYNVASETSGRRIGMSMLASKGNVSDVRKVDIYFYKPGSLGKQKNLSFIMSYGKYNANLQFGVAERLSLRFRAESTWLRAKALKMLWADSEEWRGKYTSLAHLKVFGCDSFVKVKDVFERAMKCTLVGNDSDEMRYRFRDTKSHRVIQCRDITFVDSIYGARSVTDSSSLTKPIQKSQVVLVDILENLAENDSIVAEHELSSKITQSPSRSSDMSEGFENNGSFEDSGKSDKEYFEEGASSKEEVSETPQVQRSTRESKAPWKKAINEEMVSLAKNQTCSFVRISARKKASQRLWMFKVKEEQNGRKRYKARLVVKGSQQKWEEPSYLRAMSDTSTQHKSEGFQLDGQEENLECKLNEILSSTEATNEEPCRDVHQFGDEREVKVLRSFNWPLSKLITKDDVLPERDYCQFNDVSSGYLLSKVS